MTLTDWNQYKIFVRDKLTNKMKLKTHEDIETASSEIIDILQNAVKTATPIKTRPTKAQYLTSPIKQLLTQKRKARARWQKTHTPDDKRKFNNENNKLRGAFRELKNDAFSAYIASLGNEDQTIWRPIKSRKRPQSLYPLIRANTNHPNPWAKSDTEKTNVFAKHLTELYKPNDAKPDPEITRKLTSRPHSQKHYDHSLQANYNG